ncbi:MAG: TonB-dependent receptor [Desulfobulbaceae bacterium]|jgi:vitamin B12 transporter|nr:TonB-dependent receptor [Desulfobulbaceae bacterium]
MNVVKRKKLAAFSLLLAASASFTPALAQAEQGGEVAALDTVVVTADRIKSSLKEVSANVTVLSQKDIQSSTATNVGQLLADQGFQVMNQGTTQVVLIRGMGQPATGQEWNSRVLILINGRRIGASNAALMDLNRDAIDRIEIIRGPSAVQYGSSALGGVVNIITKRGEEGLHGAAEAGFGSFGLNKQSLAVRGAGGGFDAALSLSQQGRGAYDVSGGDTWAHTNLGSSVASNFDLGYTFLKNQRVGINVNFYNQNDAEFPDNGLSGSGPKAIGYNNTYNQYNLRNSNVALEYEGAAADKLFTWSARYAFGRDENNYDPSHSMYGGTPTETDLDNRAFTAQTTYNGNALTVNAGIDYLKYSMDETGVSDAGDSEDSALFFTGRYRLFNEKLILSAGGRFDHYKMNMASDNTSEDNFAPSVGVVVVPQGWLKLRANYAEGFRMPAPNEYLGDPMYAYFYAPNMDLKPEKSKTYEVGADVTVGILTSSLTYFHSDFDDKIAALFDPTTYLSRYINLSAATIAGFEWMTSLEFHPQSMNGLVIRPRLSLTWLAQRQNGDEATMASAGSDTLPNTPEYSLSYGADFRYDAWGLNIGVTAVTSSNTLTSDYRTGSPTYGSYIEAGGATVVNMSLDKRLYAFADNHGKISLRLQVNNIFDGNNQTYLDYPGPGRNFYAGLRYEF